MEDNLAANCVEASPHQLFYVDRFTLNKALAIGNSVKHYTICAVVVITRLRCLWMRKILASHVIPKQLVIGGSGKLSFSVNSIHLNEVICITVIDIRYFRKKNLSSKVGCLSLAWDTPNWGGHSYRTRIMFGCSPNTSEYVSDTPFDVSVDFFSSLTRGYLEDTYVILRGYISIDFFTSFT
ncbi:hypothetical protein Ddye_027578 [Dipteronia dyeriana]|uniref:Uncharacterized protein n=1 Tax=Dipteronia dyeriana TaxID=168575 RepID=A0AAD9WRJ7_9ROSI|nr:hypothetical protein Ddye_027578 [Dipteronia dyeriana]